MAMEQEERLRKERGEKALKVIPINLDGYLSKPECVTSVGPQIRARKVIDFTAWKDHDAFDAVLEKLVAALQADARRKVPPPEEKL